MPRNDFINVDGTINYDNITSKPDLQAYKAETMTELATKTDNDVLSKRRVAVSLPKLVTTLHDNNPVLPLGNTGEWDAGSMRDMAMLYANGQYYMFYTGAITNVTPYTPSIGLATSPDGYTWTKQGKVFDRNTTMGLFDSGGVFSPGIYWENGIFYMYYTGINDPNQWYNGPCKIGLAISPDGITWTRNGTTPVLDRDQAWEGIQGVYACDVKKVNGKYLMLYTSHADSWWRIGAATSTDLINWVKRADNPILRATTDCAEEPSMVQLTDGTLLCFVDELNTPSGVGVYVANDLNGFSWIRAHNILSNLVADGAWCSGVLGASSGCVTPDGEVLLAINGSTGNAPESVRRLGMAILRPTTGSRPLSQLLYSAPDFAYPLQVLSNFQILQIKFETGTTPGAYLLRVVTWPEPYENFLLGVFVQTPISGASIHGFYENCNAVGGSIFIETLTGVNLPANTTIIVSVMVVGC